jgi:AAA+ superfamily predicted ATPase
MTQLITSAFDHTWDEATRLVDVSGKVKGAVVLLIDEADALAQSRESSQMHHEDRAGVNALIRGVDRLASSKIPTAVIMCTNRLSALDPAIKRRAADILYFDRPNFLQRNEVLGPLLMQLGFSKEQIESVVRSTGAREGREYGFTYSDITQRFIPTVVLDAFPNSPVTEVRALEILNQMVPTPPFKDGAL